MKPRDAFARGGLAAAACVACCAPPIIAALGVTAGLGVLAGVFIGLAAAIGVVLVGLTAIATRRRLRRHPAATAPGPVPVGAPMRRPER